ncbi:DUF3040 domain-containing protein [Streptomyces triticirhizae]|uniref:DUF3040 domain-containing protein n=1 Tax=Streptomyces triticirhizae TaxID=2483353 RepID=A0A3M2LLK5_9ACTN|nr:DUF3040 domain-containing protein [Streptomyces triticirhizae]RMI37393.1 DUF3040 domain-containing protein [Streptomyces triticirhizae]
MPLSDREQRVLEEMERALHAEDPKFATTLQGSELRTVTRKRVYQAIAGFVLGIGLLMGGMVAQLIWLSVVGFLIMLGCAVVAVTGWRRAPVQQGGQGGPQAAGGRRQRAPKRRSMMTRIEDRWQRRRDARGE